MATKTWKLGEVACGGVITVEATNTKVIIITKSWDFSTGSSKSSNQSNAKELYRKEFIPKSTNARFNISMYLNEQTTSYWADEIIDWIDGKVNLTIGF